MAKRKSKLKPARGKGKRKLQVVENESGYARPMQKWIKDIKLNNHCSIKAIKDVKNKLTKTQKKLLKEGPFRNFLKLKLLEKSPSKIIRQLAYMQASSSSKDELKFVFGDQELAFTIDDFALITGLRCDPITPQELPKVPEKSFLDTFFMKSSGKQVKLLQELFESKVVNMENEEDEDAVRVANLYLIHKVILSDQPRVKINKDFVQILYDDELTKIYPWGRLCYNKIVNNFHNLSKTEAETGSALYGFPYAVLIWAFEKLPVFQKQGDIYKIKEDKIPRMIRWTWKKQTNWESIIDTMMDKTLEITEIIPTEEEKENYLTKNMPVFQNFRSKSDFKEAETSKKGQETILQKLKKLEEKVDKLMEKVEQIVEETLSRKRKRQEHDDYYDDDCLALEFEIRQQEQKEEQRKEVEERMIEADKPDDQRTNEKNEVEDEKQKEKEQCEEVEEQMIEADKPDDQRKNEENEVENEKQKEKEQREEVEQPTGEADKSNDHTRNDKNGHELERNGKQHDEDVEFAIGEKVSAADEEILVEDNKDSISERNDKSLEHSYEAADQTEDAPPAPQEMESVA